ncbi:hypothetical protein M422DRAFT_26081 [Sphaerobolus stellatus SS14]|nr:hypothetical protein M422DRAFT_26081 [Sphaerobolus stellatus SS14]
MSGRYVPVPNPLAQSADHEIDAAFGSDDEDDDNRNETSPLNPNGDSGRAQDTRTSSHNDNYAQYTNTDNYTNTQTHTRMPSQAQRIPGAYDFETDSFDYARVPPPGSPPGSTHFAVPNPYGNSNGILPSTPVIPRRPQRMPARSNMFRRAVGALLPTHYQRVSTEDGEGPSSGPSSGPLGGGTNNDGVFANITAKPARGRVIQDGESIYVVPEEVQKEAPPSYAVAQADQAPAYYETFVHAPSGGLDGEVLVEGMPTGSIFTFAWTMLISMSFQFVGFLFTYLLHTTHAARYGSRAGLGITVIQYAFFLRRRAAIAEENVYEEIQENNNNWFNDIPSNNDTMSATPTNEMYSGYFSAATTEWLSFLLMSAGWFILLTSFLGYWRVKRWEAGIRQATEPAPAAIPASGDGDIQGRLFTVFGLPLTWEQPAHEDVDENGLALTPMPPMEDSPAGRAAREREVQLERDLRASGLL